MNHHLTCFATWYGLGVLFLRFSHLTSPRISLKIRPHHLTSLIKVAKQLLAQQKGSSSAKPSVLGLFLGSQQGKTNGANINPQKKRTVSFRPLCACVLLIASCAKHA